MMQNLQQDYVAVAKAKGMTNTHILFRHVLRPSTVTLLTVAGLNIAQLVNGAIVVEFGPPLAVWGFAEGPPRMRRLRGPSVL